jgi:hypothetical protein
MIKLRLQLVSVVLAYQPEQWLEALVHIFIFFAK